MIDETIKLDEYQLISDKYIELTIYFLDKINTKDISDNDKERFSDISSRLAIKLYEYAQNKNVSKDKISSINFEVEKLEDNIKNS